MNFRWLPAQFGLFLVLGGVVPGSAQELGVGTPPLVSATAPEADAALPPASQTKKHQPAIYTVRAGDSLWSLAQKFGTTVKKLKATNRLTKSTLKPGQTLKVPAAAGSLVTIQGKPVVKTPKPSLASQPLPAPVPRVRLNPPVVTDWGVVPSDFASCPVPVGAEPESVPSAPNRAGAAVPLTPVAPALAALPAAVVSAKAPRPTLPIKKSVNLPAAMTSDFRSVPPATLAKAGENARPKAEPRASSGPFAWLFHNDRSVGGGEDWAARFTEQARALGDRGLTYNQSWRPPGESKTWVMDCSNTSRYLYRATAGLALPRTASDQYYYLHLQNKAWDVPQTANGFASVSYLKGNLRPGDLLFWENTYRPERQPPITHVMVFLGTNARGEWIMAGSQTGKGGEHGRRRGGPDIYVFEPTKPCGGYTTWLGLVHHPGRFCAYGRPLEADATKLSVAAN